MARDFTGTTQEVEVTEPTPNGFVLSINITATAEDIDENGFFKVLVKAPKENP